MKLSYRGVRYESTPSTLEVTEGEIGGMYRGRPWQFHYLRHIPEPPPIHELKWRGVTYSRNEPAIVEPTPVAQPMRSSVTKPFFRHNRRETALDETKTMHLRNIQRALEHRMQVAKAKGDEKLLHLLEAELKQMALH